MNPDSTLLVSKIKFLLLLALALVIATFSFAQDGLSYKYYEGSWSTLPNFNALVPIKTGTSKIINLDERPNGVNDNFGFVWEGLINIPMAGNYTFETISDDGSRLYFNKAYSESASALLDNNGIHGPEIPVSATIKIDSPGRYAFAVTYFENTGGESMQVYWTGPPGSGITRQLITAAAFRDPNSLPVDVQAPSVPSNLRVVTSGPTYVILNWDNSTDDNAAIFYDVYVNGLIASSSPYPEITVSGLATGTAYSFSIKARDQAGNISEFSNAVSCIPKNINGGLQYRYYEGNWDSLPNFNELIPVATGFSKNIDLGVRPAGVNDNFGFVWEGKINIPVPGLYTFETLSDDGSRVYFDNFYAQSLIPAVNNDGIHGAWAPVLGAVNIAAAGQYPIAITYFEKNGGESMQVYWTGPEGSGIQRQLVPNSAFTANYAPLLDSIAPSVPADLKALSVRSNDVDLDWDDAMDNIGVVSYNVYVNGVKQYTTGSSFINANHLDFNTQYSFTIQAVDLAGNVSPYSTALIVKTISSTNGLNYRYYEGEWDALPDFSKLTPVKAGTTANVDINIRPEGKNDHFAFVWEGYINIPTAGNYTFETLSDDGSKLYLFSKYDPTITALINNDGLHASVSSTGKYNFTAAGKFPITITYFDKDGGENMEVYWTGPGINRQIIPASSFVQNAEAAYSHDYNLIVPEAIRVALASEDLLGNIKTYPNPFIEGFRVSFSNASASNKISIEIYDLAGRLVLNHKVGQLSMGANTVTVQMNGNTVLPAIYLVKIMVNGKARQTFTMLKANR